MEMSLAYASSPSTPMCFNNGVLRTRFTIPTIEKSTGPSSSSSGFSTSNRGRRKAVPVIKALKAKSSSRPTLSNDWDITQGIYSATSPTWLPRFEDLDTTNMLLRQRIIFLGSQVLILKIVSFFIKFYLNVFGYFVGILVWLLYLNFWISDLNSKLIVMGLAA